MENSSLGAIYLDFIMEFKVDYHEVSHFGIYGTLSTTVVEAKT